MKFNLQDYRISEEFKMLSEMAYSISDVKEFLEESEQQRIENLMQIYIIGGDTVNHWCNELCACCHECKIVKSTKRRLSEIKILDYIWNCWSDCFYEFELQYCMNICDKECINTLPEYDSDKLFSFMKEYHFWLAKQLANNDRIYSKDVKEKISELILKWK